MLEIVIRYDIENMQIERWVDLVDKEIQDLLSKLDEKAHSISYGFKE